MAATGLEKILRALQPARNSLNPLSNPLKIDISLYYSHNAEVGCRIDPDDGKRVWKISIRVDGNPHHKCPKDYMDLKDFLTAEEYPEVFQRYAVKSLKGTPLRQKSIDTMETQIEEYGRYLVSGLGFDNIKCDQKNITVHIVEDTNIINKSALSLHSITWEQLENPSSWPGQHNRPKSVTVTRSILANTNYGKNNQSENHLSSGGRHDQPIRILLITGRKLHRSRMPNTFREGYIEESPPSIVQRRLMQVIQHLDEIGIKRKVHLDILRPASRRDLEDWLGVSTPGRVDFDIVQIDMHGEILNRLPGFNFTSAPATLKKDSGEEFEPFITAVDLSRILKGRTDHLVMNTCNLSGSDGSSQTAGEVGISLIRPFLEANIGCISATSYEVEITPSAIYHMRFYMSLLLKACSGASLTSSFARATAEGRDGLRHSSSRVDRTRRDDSFVFWNWATTPRHTLERYPTPELWLWFRMLLECILWYVYRLIKFRSGGSKDQWRRELPFWSVHKNYDNLEDHIECALQLDIPPVPIHALEIEFFLKHHRKNSVLIYPISNTEIDGWEKIRGIIRNMARVWVDTNFVLEVHVLDLKKMFDQGPIGAIYARYQDRVAGKSSYQRRTSQAEWSVRQAESSNMRKRPRIKSMLIIEEIQILTDLGNCLGTPFTTSRSVQGRRAARVLNMPKPDVAKRKIERARERIRQAVKRLQTNNGGDGFYLLATGKIEGDIDPPIDDRDPKQPRWYTDLPQEIDKAVGGRLSNAHPLRIGMNDAAYRSHVVEAKYARQAGARGLQREVNWI